MPPTLELGLGDLAAGLGGSDRVGADGIHEGAFEHARPVLHTSGHVALSPVLEVILALACRGQKRGGKPADRQQLQFPSPSLPFTLQLSFSLSPPFLCISPSLCVALSYVSLSPLSGHHGELHNFSPCSVYCLPLPTLHTGRQ